MSEFIFYTIWFIIIAVAINIIMEKVWVHVANRFPGQFEHDERGEAMIVGRHRG